MDEKINVYTNYDDEKIIIEIPIDSLLFMQENREDLPFQITDKGNMLEWLHSKLIEYDDKEDGSTAFSRFIDGAFQDAYEHGEAWLEGIVYEGEQ